MAFADLSDQTGHMSKIKMQLIGTVQWYLENEGPEKRENPGNILIKCLFLFLNAQFHSNLQDLKAGIYRFIRQN